MAIYHFTFHAYCSWMPDRKRGYVRDKKILPSDPEMADKYREQAKQPAVVFKHTQLKMLLSATNDICVHRKWKPFAFASESTHVHVVIGWRGFEDCRKVRAKMANLLSKFLGEQIGESGRRWFARRPSRKRVRDREHLKYLLDEYLPRHQALFWRHDRHEAPPPLSTYLNRYAAPRASARG